MADDHFMRRHSDPTRGPPQYHYHPRSSGEHQYQQYQPPQTPSAQPAQDHAGHPHESNGGHFSWLASKLRRLTGEENYRFGDFTRELVRRYRDTIGDPGPTAATPSPASAHNPGRSSATPASHERSRNHSRNSAFSSSSDDISMSQSPPYTHSPSFSYILSRGPAASIPTPVSIDEFWTAFFRSAYEAGSAAVNEGSILFDDLDCQEPFLYLGVPGLAILDVILESIRLTAKKEIGTDVMVIGGSYKVKSAMFPPTDSEVLPWFESMVRAKYDVAKTVFTKEEIVYLRHVVLCASTKDEDPSIGSSIDEEKQQKIHRTAGLIQGLATNLTQTSWYKHHFADIIESLAIDCSHATPQHEQAGLAAAMDGMALQ